MAFGIAAMRQQRFVRATRVEQGVVKDGHALEGAVSVDAIRDTRNSAVVPAED